MELFVVKWWSEFGYQFGLFARYLDTLHAGAFILLVTVLIGLQCLRILILALSVGGWDFFCNNYFIWFLLTIRLHCDLVKSFLN